MVKENFKICSSEMRKNVFKYPPWLEKILGFVLLKWLKCIQISTMVGEHFKICSSEVAKKCIQVSTMVGENFKISSSELPKDVFKYPP